MLVPGIGSGQNANESTNICSDCQRSSAKACEGRSLEDSQHLLGYAKGSEGGRKGCLVPLAGIEPALLAESDFESDASTSSAIGARSCSNGCGLARQVICTPSRH